MFLNFLIGACWASFCLTWASRHLLHQGANGRWSCCDSCGHRLAWWQLIPVGGWLLQRGRCHWCRQPIAPFASIWELASGLWVALLAPDNWLTWLSALTLLFCLLAAVTTDWVARWIQPWTYLGLLALIWLAPASLLPLDLALSGLAALLLVGVAVWRRGLGRGDVEWLLVILLFSGWPLFWHLLLVACPLAACQPTLWRGQPRPFLPFLATGLLVALLF